MKRRLLFFVLLLSGFQALAQDFPPDSLYRQGERLYFDKQYEEAIPKLTEALEKGLQRDGWAYVYRASCYQNLRQYEQALVDYEIAITKVTDNPVVFFHYGSCLRRVRKYEKAIAVIEKVMEMRDSPQGSDGYELGLNYYNLNEFEKGFKHFKKTSELLPSSPEPIFWMGECRQQQLRNEEAVVFFNKTFELDKDYYYSYPERGLCYSNMGEYGRAIADYEAYLKHDPENYWVLSKMASCKSYVGRSEEAILDLNRVIELAPDNAEAYQDRGSIKSTIGKHEAGLKDLNQAVAMDSANDWNYFLRAQVRVKLRDYEGALKDLDTAIALDDYALFYHWRARIRFYYMKQPALAKADLEVSIAHTEDCQDARAYSLMMVGREQEAIEYFKKQISKSKYRRKKAGNYYDLGCIYSLMGRKEDALKQLDKCLDLGYSNYDHLRYDHDWSNIRKTPEFASLMAKYNIYFPVDAMQFQREQETKIFLVEYKGK